MNANLMNTFKPIPNTSQVITFTSGSAVDGAAIDKGAVAVLISASAACFVEFTSSGKASLTTSLRVPANIPMIVGLDLAGTTGAIPSLIAAAGAILYVTPLSE